MASTLTSQQEKELSSRYNRRMLLGNLVVLLIVFVVVTFLIPNGSQRNLFTWEQTQLRITFPDETSQIIPYDSITAIFLVDAPEMGTCLSGEDGSNYRYGLWKNEVLGEYTLCAYKSFSSVIQLTTKAGIYWISYESAQTTEGLYQSIVQTLTQEGYVFSTTAR